MCGSEQVRGPPDRGARHSDKPLSEAERKMAEVAFQTEVVRGFDPTRFADARGEFAS